jgi:quinol-cytochrome oxidoreductase complex cytochrome b subunit
MRFTLSFGLGGMAAVLVLTLLVSGILQLLSYSAEVGLAYASVQAMYAGGLAGFVRNIHFWAGNLLVIVVSLHLLRVFLTGALREGRQWNWLLGLVLYGLVLFANFTGYLMPWDQLAYWAVTIFTAMLGYLPLVGEQLSTLVRGGETVSAATLAIFFALHAGILPLLLGVGLLYHFWLVRKAGGLVQQKAMDGEKRARVDAVPHLILREVLVGFALLAALLVFAAGVDAPLAEIANPGQSPNPAKAAWYFMGLQELLLHFHPVLAICVLPLLLLALLAALPFISGLVLPGGIWFGGSRGRALGLTSLLGGALLTAAAVTADEFLASPPVVGETVLQGAVPMVVILGLLVLFSLVCRRRGATPAESAMAILMGGCGAIFSLTVIGIWFRGPEMALVMLW